MACFQCGKEPGTPLTLCPECAQKKKLENEQTKELRIAALQQTLEDPEAVRKQLILVAGVLSAMIILLTTMLYMSGTFGFGTLAKAALSSPTNTSIPLSTDPCAAKERCVIVYMSPRNADCDKGQVVLNELRNLSASNDKVTVQVIVGGAKIEDLVNYAANLGGDVYLDFKGEFAQLNSPGSLPYWWVIDKKRAVSARGSGILEGGINTQSATKDFIRAYLKIKEYF